MRHLPAIKMTAALFKCGFVIPIETNLRVTISSKHGNSLSLRKSLT